MLDFFQHPTADNLDDTIQRYRTLFGAFQSKYADDVIPLILNKELL